MICIIPDILEIPGKVAGSVERSRIQEIVGSNPGRVKPMTYLLLPSLVLGIIRIAQGLVSSVSG